MATVQKRGKSYRIRVSDGYTAAGKQVTRSMTWTPDPGMTARQIEKELQRQIVQFEDGNKKAASLKFESLAAEWLADYAPQHLRPRTLALYNSLTGRTYAALGHLRIDKVTAKRIQEFISSLGKPGSNKKTGGPLSPKTQGHYLTLISDVLAYAVRLDIISDNPAKRVQVPKTKPKEKQVYTLEQAQTILDNLSGESLWFQVFVILAIYSGFRRGELLGLEWKDIDFATGVVTVRRSSLYTKAQGVFTDTTKTKGSQRALKLPAVVFEYLKAYQAQQRKTRLSLGDKWHPCDRLFTAWDGRPMSTNAPYRALWRYCAKIGLPNLGIHSFRHLNASLLITSGADVRTVSAALGHSQTSTTLNIYAHTFAAVQAQAADALADALPLANPKKHKKA